MVESEVAALIAPWLTPTSLFVLLNIVLATIFFASNSSKKHDNSNGYSYEHSYHQSLQHQDSYEGAALVPPPPQLVRAPSLFSRVASFNFSNTYYSQLQTPTSDAPDTVTRAPSLLYRVTSFNFRRAPQQNAVEAGGETRTDEVEETGAVRTENQQEGHQAEVEVEEKVVKVKRAKNKKVKKKVTEVKNGENSMAEKEEVSRVTEVKKVKEELVKETASSRQAEQGVDSKADDFINMFKQQLKMQRLESLLRYGNSTAT